MMPKRTANARWNGSLTEGDGTMRMASGAYEGPYSFQSRFEEGDGTNPEELIAAAHAGCFSMALSGELGRAGHDPESVETEAVVHLEKTDGGFAIKRIELNTRARVPGIDEDAFQRAAQAAKEGCPVSQALAAVETIEVDARLES
jgi:osmotically inducible protein OsmC